MSNAASDQERKYASFAEFYPFYLAEHSDRTSRRLHFIGSSLAIVCLGLFIATFKYPLYSLAGDWRMYWELLTGKIPL